MKKILLLSLLMSLIFQPAFAQFPSLSGNSTDKVCDALREFMQTDFMRQYSDLRIKVEAEFAQFIANSGSSKRRPGKRSLK